MCYGYAKRIMERFMSNKPSAHITSNTPLQPALQGWEIYLKDQGSSPHTVKAFMADMRLLASYLSPDQTLGGITTTDINNFLDWMQNDRGVPCSPKTLARRITSIKAFFRWLHEAGALMIDPGEKIVQKSVMSPTPTVLNQEEVDLILEVAEHYRTTDNPDTRYYTLVRLLLATGIKKGECLNLSPNHIDLEAANGPILFVRYANPKYRYKERKIKIPPDWVDVYSEYQDQYELTDRLFPWSPRRLEYLLEDLSDEAAIDKHLSFDMCRWTCALADWNSGMEHNKIRQKLGISKVQWREVKMKLQRLSKKETT
jgi:integrase/recombinase XerD